VATALPCLRSFVSFSFFLFFFVSFFAPAR
jgi:hypothetical protein